MRALLCTHHLSSWTGSEVVLAEIAEALADEGVAVDIYAPFHDERFAPANVPLHDRFQTDPRSVALAGYDLVYVQHQTLSRIVPLQPEATMFGPERPYFHYAHLSSVEPFELPGPFVERDIADSAWAQSPRTLEEYERRFAGRVPDALECVPNPAPAAFERPRDRAPTPRLRRLLSVSNHLPEELAGAFEILRAEGVEITRFGHPEHNRRLTAEALASHDAVVTIGKTTQYAIRSGAPVFCYDHFGGPGWLDADTFEACAWRNFSGLDSPGRRDAKDLAEAITSGFAAAERFMLAMPPERRSPYRLETHVAALCARVRAHRSSPRPLPVEAEGPCDRARVRARWAHEADLYALIDREYERRRGVQAAKKAEKRLLAETNRRLREENARLKAQLGAAARVKQTGP